MFDIGAIAQSTDRLLDRNIKVLSPFMLADTEREHVALLLEMMDPPAGAHILDAGCGTGEVARIMRDIRPDLQFTLLNVSGHQLAYAPDDMRKVLSSFDDVPDPDQTFDVVMFSQSIAHSTDWLQTLSEARRVTKEGGEVFIFDMERRSGDNVLMSARAQAAVWPIELVLDVARRAGLVCDLHINPKAVEDRLRALAAPAEYEVMYGGVLPVVWKFRRLTVDDPIESAFSRHRRIGFQFSGGRDSTAALYSLRPYWGRMTVYHLDTGDTFPETQAVVQAVHQEVPVTVIRSDVKGYRDAVGWPSDVVPADTSAFGCKVSGSQLKLVSRYECCYQNLMRPIYDRMLADGITLLVRGSRDEDYAQPPSRTGDRAAGMEVLHPIQSWTTADVDRFIAEERLPLASYYAHGAQHGSDCMGCTAWWDDGRLPWLREQHPVVFKEFERRMALINGAIENQFAPLRKEMNHG